MFRVRAEAAGAANPSVSVEVQAPGRRTRSPSWSRDGRTDSPHGGAVAPAGQIALVDLLDRLLGTGVVLAGDVVISLAGIDLVQVRLHALITSVRSQATSPTAAGVPT